MKLLAATLIAIGLLSCRSEPDPSTKASRSDCDAACARIATPDCSDTCIERQWTMGDVRCVLGAKTTEEARGCGVAARVLLDARRAAEQADIAARRAKLREQMDAQEKRVDALIAELKGATDEPTRTRIMKQLDEEKALTAKLVAEAADAGM